MHRFCCICVLYEIFIIDFFCFQLTAKNIQCMRAILSVAHCHGGILGSAWHVVLTTLQVGITKTWGVGIFHDLFILVKILNLKDANFNHV